MASVNSADWQESAWDDGVVLAAKETGVGVDIFPEIIPWDINEVLKEGWLPE